MIGKLLLTLSGILILSALTAPAMASNASIYQANFDTAKLEMDKAKAALDAEEELLKTANTNLKAQEDKYDAVMKKYYTEGYLIPTIDYSKMTVADKDEFFAEAKVARIQSDLEIKKAKKALQPVSEQYKKAHAAYLLAEKDFKEKQKAQAENAENERRQREQALMDFNAAKLADKFEDARWTVLDLEARQQALVSHYDDAMLGEYVRLSICNGPRGCKAPAKGESAGKRAQDDKDYAPSVK